MNTVKMRKQSARVQMVRAAKPRRTFILCRECGRVVHLMQGIRSTAWYHEDDDTLVCGGRVWKVVPVASIPRLWAPVRRSDEPVTL